MLRAARLDRGLYDEVEADITATTQALSVVVIVAIASGISFALSNATRGGGAGTIVGALLFGVLAAVIGWAAQSAFVYWVGTRLFSGTATYREVLRTLGFAQSPGVLYLFSFVPVLGGLIALVAFLWTLACDFVAIREALDLDIGRTVATIVVAIIAFAIVFWLITTIFVILGIGASGLLGR
jgi:hypothetical protein